MKFLLSLSFALLLCGCEKPEKVRTTWEYRTLIVYDDTLRAPLGTVADGEFAKMNITEEMKNYLMDGDWAMCGCFLEPKKDPRLIIIFKRPVP